MKIYPDFLVNATYDKTTDTVEVTIGVNTFTLSCGTADKLQARIMSLQNTGK